MRVSFAIQKETTLLSLNQKQENMMRLSDQISSGVRFSSPSDDPYSWAQSMDVKQGLREYDSILGNISYASGWNKATDSALNHISDFVSEARQAAISAQSPSSADHIDALVAQMDEIIKETVSGANAMYGDKYLFSGTETSTVPYTFNSGTITYNGDSNRITVRTDRGGAGSSDINQTGPEVMDFTSGGTTLNVVTEMWNLREAIRTGDAATITNKLGTLQDAFTSIGKQSTIVGTRLASYDNQTSAINSIKVNEKSTLSDLEDTDLTDAIVTLQQEQTAFQAALQVTGMMKDLHLTNYI